MENELVYIIVKGKIGAKVEIGSFGPTFYTCDNGHQWSGESISKEKAEIMVEVLKKYLERVEKE